MQQLILPHTSTEVAGGQIVKQRLKGKKRQELYLMILRLNQTSPQTTLPVGVPLWEEMCFLSIKPTLG
jgi:hypothetical protein